MANRNRIFIFGSLLAPIALYFGSSMVMDHFDKEGWRFFNTGKDIVTNLATMAKAVKEKDPAGVEKFYASGFHGKRLGLTKLQQVEEKDGMHRSQFKGEGETATREAAAAEWREYVNSFDAIEEAGLHIHKLESLDDPKNLVASVRFELIGTPKGAAHAGIDRAYFRMKFDASGGNILITEASPIEGDRIIADKPQFSDVSHAAGIDFENRYYPAFINQQLKFA
ncbi:MAG: hypothetical protein ABIZ80_09030, partial [Bryobacteraceae bacterium]